MIMGALRVRRGESLRGTLGPRLRAKQKCIVVVDMLQTMEYSTCAPTEAQLSEHC